MMKRKIIPKRKTIRKRKIIRPPGRPTKPPGSESVILKLLSKQYNVPVERLSQLNVICRAKRTTLEKIPFWLLRKSPRRLEHWFMFHK